MFLWSLLAVTAVSALPEGLNSFINEGELINDETKFLSRILPGIPSSNSKNANSNRIGQFSNIIDDDINFKNFQTYMEKGITSKGLTFNVYNDNMRDATVVLYKFLKTVDKDDLPVVKEWARNYINNDMFDYALQLAALHKNMYYQKEFLPPFIRKPNYFVNSETIIKALKLKAQRGYFEPQDSQINQYYRTDETITINTNYSGWNQPHKSCEKQLDYFREDVALNSYYYGIHLLHPFLAVDNTLNISTTANTGDYFYYRHQQLSIRYMLEKQHFLKNSQGKETNCDKDVKEYNPYLIYDNGLPFPVRPSDKGSWSDAKANISLKRTALTECLRRGYVILSNGVKHELNENNYKEILTQALRENFDSTKTAKDIRTVYGYGGNEHLSNRYNPAPSVLHHPETSLRDPMFWHLILAFLRNFEYYKKLLTPYDLSKYENKGINILDHKFSKIITYFDHYEFSINKALGSNYEESTKTTVFSARQKRIDHLQFTLNFTVDSKIDNEVIVRIFLGPECSSSVCWDVAFRFFELDKFSLVLSSGTNNITWSTHTSDRYSFDDFYNIALAVTENKYNLFKFPINLAIPKGLKDGLNMTLFIMITPKGNEAADLPNSSYFYDLDSQPLGFPFHKQVMLNTTSETATNYKFYNLTIYHIERTYDETGFFSPYLN